MSENIEMPNPKTVDEKYSQVGETIRNFAHDIDTQWRQAISDGREEFQRLADSKAMKHIYGNRGVVNQYVELKVNKDNFLTVENLLNLYQEYEKRKIEPDDEARISKEGAKFGFTPEESLVIYNMVLYEKAIDNVETQKKRTMELLLSDQGF